MILTFLNFCEKEFLRILGEVFSNQIAFVLAKATLETIYMVIFSTLFAVIFGLPLGVILSTLKPKGILENSIIYKGLNVIVNVTRSFPFIVLVFLFLPLSRMLIGTSIGSTAALIPLIISATPFIARLFENALDEMDSGLIEAALSLGASKARIIAMMISESLPSIMGAITVTTISLVGYSAMAGVLGAGGLGDLAYRIGFQSFKPDILFYAVICIIVLVQGIQMGGDIIIKFLRKNR